MNRRDFLTRLFAAIAAFIFAPFLPKSEANSLPEGTEVFVPTFEMGVYPQVRLSEIKARRFHVVDRIQIKSKTPPIPTPDDFTYEPLTLPKKRYHCGIPIISEEELERENEEILAAIAA